MPELIVTAKEIRYAGKSHLRGARFEASAKDAKVLKAIGKADDAPAPERPMRKVAETTPPVVAEPVAEPAGEPAVEAEKPPRSQFYRTRRLKADD